jgi:hypothetical protein
MKWIGSPNEKDEALTVAQVRAEAGPFSTRARETSDMGTYEGWGAFRNERDLLSALTTKVAVEWNMSTKVADNAAVLIMVDDMAMAVAEEDKWNKMIRIK